MTENPDITWLLFEDHGVTGLGRARTVDVDGNVVEGPEPWLLSRKDGKQ